MLIDKRWRCRDVAESWNTLRRYKGKVQSNTEKILMQDKEIEENKIENKNIFLDLRCRKGRYSFLWIAPLTLDIYLILQSVEQGSIKYLFLSLWYDATWDWTQISQTIGENVQWLSSRQNIISVFGSHRQPNTSGLMQQSGWY